MSVGLQQSTIFGLGYRLPPTKLKARVPSDLPADVVRGEVYTFDILLEQEGTLGLYADPPGQPNTRTDPYSSVRHVVGPSVPRAFYPAAVAAENIARGRIGTFFLTHHDIDVMIGTTAGSVTAIVGDTLIVGNLSADNAVIILNGNTSVINSGWARVVGTANQAGTGAGTLIRASFDGYHLGMVGGAGI